MAGAIPHVVRPYETIPTRKYFGPDSVFATCISGPPESPEQVSIKEHGKTWFEYIKCG